MAYTPQNVDFEQEKDTPENILRRLERHFEWQAEDWHFKLLRVMEPYEVYSWFGQAKLHVSTLYYDGGTRRGVVCFDWVRQKYERQIHAALGDVKVCLVKDRQVIKSFTVAPVSNNRTHETKARVSEICGRMFEGVPV